MSNFEKLVMLMQQLNFFIDDGIVNDKNCGSVLEEIYSAIEILVDCGEDFESELRELKVGVKI